MSFKDKIDKQNIPQHVAIIMDGNGRWAKKQNKKRMFGHKEGANSTKKMAEAAIEIGVKYLTLYTFSTENWNRPKKEVEALMSLLIRGVKDELNELHKENIRILTIGDETRLPKNVLKYINKAKEKTKNNTRLFLTIALSYSSKWEIINAVNNIIKDVKNNIITDEFINENIFASYLATNNTPDPELLIRTGGEKRISNFLLWQIAYSELIFSDILWPDYKKEQFFETIYLYQQRERRFGKTSEQIKK